MSIAVRIPTSMACLCDGARSLEAEGSTVAEVLLDLRRRYPHLGARLCDEAGTPATFVRVFVDDEVDIRALEGVDTPVRTAMTLHVLAGAAGG
ncbi:MAG TPA: molybdopterin synthase sulfur carrier subunit [Acidimicrobiia bacterium]|jgi:molybdopterin synthase sulfur carrier subunit